MTDRIPERAPAKNELECQRTILIVDDEPIMLRVLDQYFSDCGYRVLLAADGRQGMDVYRKHRSQIDVVLLDIDLPIVPGEALFEAMRNDNPAINVVIGTGFVDETKKNEMIAAGVKGFVNKPYVLNELLEICGGLREKGP
jgi:two-component system cell cycle sensor histidine kinase/response regulator CckA